MKLVRKSLHKAWVFESLGRTTSSATRTSCTDDSSTFLTLRVTSAWRQTDAQVAELACRLDRGIRRRRIKGNLFEYLSWVGPVTSDHRKTTKPEAHKASKSTMNDSGQTAEK